MKASISNSDIEQSKASTKFSDTELKTLEQWKNNNTNNMIY